MDKYHSIKSRLREYLNRRGIRYNDKSKTWACPGHADEKPSAVLYENPDGHILWCPVCQASWSIFEVCGLIDGIPDHKDTFPKKLESVKSTLGIYEEPEKKPAQKKEAPVSLPREEAKNIYTRARIIEIYRMSKRATLDLEKAAIVNSWAYTTETGDIIGMDVRLEDGSGDKNVITYWYNGRSLKTAGAPVLIFNLYEAMQSEKPILIHEGAKCATAAAVLENFISVSWSGGAAKPLLADWKPFDGREIFILPDDDDPGIKAAELIKKQLPQAKIIKPVIAAREKKPKGADIEEILQIMSPDEITAYILNPENHLEVSGGDPSGLPGHSSSPPLPPVGDRSDGSSSEPFKILGIGDDGRANFIDAWGYHHPIKLSALSKGILNDIADLNYWKLEFPNGKAGVDWAEAQNYLIIGSKMKDFHISSIRGRGAWHDGEKISYHDGVKTYGEWDEKKIYLRSTRQNIGIEDEPIKKELALKIKDVIFRLSFETPADAVRCMGWSVLAPFAGALKYRPAMLLTGGSGTGKSTVANIIIKPLSNCLWLNGSESTVAGVRGKVQRDSVSIVFEETEKDTDKKKMNREELFSLMRVNVTDDAPDTIKGTKEGGYNSFKMQNMFGFIAIDPTIDSIADENRIFRINMTTPQNVGEWKKLETELSGLLNEKNCRSIRALTWNKLKIIFALADRIVDLIRTKTNRDFRSSYSDALLAGAFMVIWTGVDNPSDDQIDKMLDKYYSFQPPESHRDESSEIIDRLMDEVIEIIHDKTREKITVLEGLTRVFRGMNTDDEFYSPDQLKNYRQHLARIGIRLYEGDKIAIANNHHMIKKIINHGEGYAKIFKRHPGWIERKLVSFSGDKNRQATIISGIIVKQDDEKSDDEKLMEMI